MMEAEAKKVAQGYPDIKLKSDNIDAVMMWLTKNPENYGVIIAGNMFGDIVSDGFAGLVGGLGFACSANVGRDVAVFEPTHGSAPKYAGLYKVNPIATFLAAELMLEWLGETDKAKALDGAIAEVIREGLVRTYDMGGASTTLEMGRAVAAKL
jgi:3-isopropylmalate dehydrogenase